MEDGIKNNDKIYESSANKTKQNIISIKNLNEQKSERKGSPFKNSLENLNIDKISKENIYKLKSDQRKYSPNKFYRRNKNDMLYDVNLSDFGKNSDISKEKKFYLHLENNFEVTNLKRKVNYSPQVTPRTTEEISHKLNLVDNGKNGKIDYYSISIDTTMNNELRMENILKNRNKMSNNIINLGTKLNIPENKDKLINKIVVTKEKDNYFTRFMKISNQFGFNKNNHQLNKVLYSPLESKYQTKKLDINKNKNETKPDFYKKKKSLRDYFSKKNKNIKPNTKQKIVYNTQNKEVNKPIKNKEKQLFLDIGFNQQYNIIIYDKKDKDINKKGYNLNNLLKNKKSENQIVNTNQLKRNNKPKDKSKIIKTDRNIQKMAEISEKNCMNENKNQHILVNSKETKHIENDQNNTIGNTIVKNQNINNEQQNIIKIDTTNNINNKIMIENADSENLVKNIIIKRDLSNKNNNLIYISKNNEKSHSSKGDNKVQIPENSNNIIYISKYSQNRNNNDLNSNNIARKISENLQNTNINLNKEIKNNMPVSNSTKNLPSRIINNNNMKNNNVNNNNIIISLSQKNSNENIYENSNNDKIGINILNNQNKIINENNIDSKENNLINNVIKNKLSGDQNNFINTNLETSEKNEIIKKNDFTKNKNQQNIKTKNKNTNKIIDKVNNKNNNQKNKMIKINKQNRSVINNKENKNTNNMKLINKNNSNNNLNKNNIHKNSNFYDSYKINTNSNNKKNNLSQSPKTNKKPSKIIIQNVIIENNASNNNIFFSNNIISPNNYLINSIKEPFYQNNCEELQKDIYINNNLYTENLTHSSESLKDIIYPLNEKKNFHYNMNNNLKTLASSPSKNTKIKIEVKNKQLINDMKNTKSSSGNISLSAYNFGRSNSAVLENYNERLISSEIKNSSKLIVIRDSIKEKRLKNLKSDNSLLSIHPKVECFICNKFIESHLLQIHINTHPSQIFNWLYLGTFTNACDKEELRRINIKYILNCASDCKNKSLPEDIEELHLKVRDEKNFNLLPFFEQSNEFINKVRLLGKNILIHCKYGISRSVAFVMAYLIKYFGFDVNSAFEFIKKQRDIINPNKGFIEQLKQYEKLTKNELKSK